MKGAEKAYLRVQRSRVEIAVLHAYAALARGRSGLRKARSWSRRIEKERLGWSEPVVRIVAASVAFGCNTCCLLNNPLQLAPEIDLLQNCIYL